MNYCTLQFAFFSFLQKNVFTLSRRKKYYFPKKQSNRKRDKEENY